jgi:hypothetical protein
MGNCAVPNPAKLLLQDAASCGITIRIRGKVGGLRRRLPASMAGGRTAFRRSAAKMPEPQFATIDDDLPRTFRREREAREREARDREAREREALEREAAIIEPAFLHRDPPSRLIVPPTAEDRLQIGFLRLMAFSVKVVFAAIPAVLILAVLLWLGGQALATFFPQLPRMQIFIHFPNPKI